MSEIATEISGVQGSVTDLEFLGGTFAERKLALQRVDAFRRYVKDALRDSVAVFVGQEVEMTFRPSSITSRQYPNISVPCYSMQDEVRDPVTKNVTIRRVGEDYVSVTAGELVDGNYDTKWSVGLQNVVSIEPIIELNDPS